MPCYLSQDTELYELVSQRFFIASNEVKGNFWIRPHSDCYSAIIIFNVPWYVFLQLILI